MRVRSAIAEKGIPHRSRVIAPGGKLDRSGRTSVLMMIDGDVVSDPLPILEYLESRWPEPPLFPARLGVAAVTGSLARVDATFVPELLRIARGTAVERADALGRTRTGMGILDGEIPESHYLLGEFSAADLALASVIACLPRDWRPAQLGFQGLARWERTVMSRPAVREQMAPVAC
jgi:glutathione S-transferase